ncbi:MAG: internal scaffolding protein [Microvirus sp.]|nr:MAG: internal scaffolding protein [Microvirus sp.]
MIPPKELDSPKVFQSIPRWTPFLRTPYNYDRDQASLESGLTCEDPSLTVQADSDDADINVIMARFGQGNVLPENFRTPSYGDFTSVNDFHTAMQAVRSAEENFMLMPPKLRARFNNDPGQLLDFLGESSNLEEAVKLGLVNPPLQDPPIEAVKPASPGPAKPVNG